jgi:hypothetical protein
MQGEPSHNRRVNDQHDRDDDETGEHDPEVTHQKTRS